MRSHDKRIDKLSANLSTKERSLAIIDAFGRDNVSTALSLVASAPMKTYSQRDAAVTDFVDTVETISLIFDRGYYAIIANLLEIDQSDCSDRPARRHNMEHQLRGFIAGLQLFSERIDISTDRLLTFSIANQQKLLNKRMQKRETLSDEDTVLAETICSNIEEIWRDCSALTMFSVGLEAEMKEAS
jgi:hypothetical protein